MKKDLFITFLTQVLVLICGLLVYRAANQQLGYEGFAIYALCRRTNSFLFPALAVGCSVAIPRYIAFSRTKNKQMSDSYFKGGMFIVSITVFIFTLIVNMFPEVAAKLLFSNSKYSNLAAPISMMMVGYMLHSISYAYYRGHTRMVACNLLQIINIAIIPVVAAYTTKTPEAMLGWTGVGWVFTGGCVFAMSILPKLTGSLSCMSLKEVFVFGIQRMPSDFGFATLFGLPATLTAHSAGVIAGGHVAFGISLLNMCGSVFGPIGLVLLPRASAAIACNDSAFINKYIKLALIGTSVLSFTIFLIFEFAAEPILKLYLGSNLSPSLVSTTRIVMLASVPYSIYVASRSMIDAFFVIGINTINVLLALGLFMILVNCTKLEFNYAVSPLSALVASLFLLTTATLMTCYYIVRNNKTNLH